MAGGRQDVPRITILLIGGQHSSSDVNALRSTSKTLKESGSNTYVIAVGKDHKTPVMLQIVQTPEHIFLANNFDELHRDMDGTARSIARTAGKLALFVR